MSIIFQSTLLWKEEGEKTEETKPIFESLYLGSALVGIWNAGY